MHTSPSSAYGAFVLRMTLAVMFFAHAALKVFVFTVPGTVAFFQSLGLPGVFAYLTIAAETLGGVAMLLGLQTRLAAVLVLPVLLGATWAHAGNGWVFNAPNGGWEYPLFLTLAAVVQALLGGGVLALDNVLAARRAR